MGHAAPRGHVPFGVLDGTLNRPLLQERLIFIEVGDRQQDSDGPTMTAQRAHAPRVQRHHVHASKG